MITYATLCSGIEAVSLGWEPLGWKPLWFSEVAPFPSRVLEHHYPGVPNLGDMTTIRGEDYAGKVDVLWGSTPCQSMSAAGLRKGITDPRGKLMLSYCDIVHSMDPKVACWENVKGALNDKNNAFGHFLGRLCGESVPLVPAGSRWSNAGYVLGPKRNIAWRLIDSKYSGLAQRRERVFVVSCPVGGLDPREILFEETPAGEICGKSPPRMPQYSGTPSESNKHAYAIAIRGRGGVENIEMGSSVANCLLASQGGSDKPFCLIDDGSPRIRMLMPSEAELLMGMSGHYTDIPGATDGQRYHAIGNSIAVTETRWLGERIEKYL